MTPREKIVIICPNEELTKSWKQAFEESAPDIEVQIYPDDTEREKTQFILTFQPPKDVFKEYPNLKVIASMAAGINHLTEANKIPKNVVVTKANDPMHKGDIAHFVLALALSQMRRLPLYMQQKTEANWEPHPYLRPEDTTVGIMGVGAIGQIIGKLMLKNDFKVTGWSRSKKHLEGIATFHGQKQKGVFLKTADILICALPLTEETENILNAEAFGQLPKEAYLINIGRGDQLVEEDLTNAIEKGHLSGAALDVFREEPLPKNHPFWKNKKIFITPHTAGNVHPESAVKKVIKNYKAMKNDEDLVDVVDLERGY